MPAEPALRPDRAAAGEVLPGAAGPRAWIAGAAIAAAGFASYFPTLRAGFVFDDHLLLGDGALVRGPLGRLWFSTAPTDWWPLTWTSFWIEHRLWGDAPLGYHAVNVLLHVAAAILLWRALRALAVPGAWLAGLLFALHPVAVESVAWVSERKNVLSGALFLGAILAWIRFDGGARRRWAVLSWALHLLALLAKTSAVMLPFVLLGIAAWRRDRVARRDVLRSLPFLALSLALGAVTAWFQWTRAMPHVVAPRSVAERVGGAAWALLSYLQKAFVPVGLAFVYPDWPVRPGSAVFWVPLAAVLLLAALLWWQRRGPGRPVAFAVAYHALMVLPILGLVDMSYLHVGPVSNHLQYLALMGPVALVAGGLATLAGGRWRVPAAALAAALVAWLGAATWRRAASFESDLTLWSAAARDAPGSLYAAWMYADQLGLAGRYAESLAELSAFADRAPDEASRRRARAAWLFKSGQPGAALEEALAAERIRPDPNFAAEMGQLLARSGHPGPAIELLAPVLRREPRAGNARYWLAASLARVGRDAEAAEVLREGLRIDPGDQRLREALEVTVRRTGGR